MILKLVLATGVSFIVMGKFIGLMGQIVSKGWEAAGHRGYISLLYTSSIAYISCFFQCTVYSTFSHFIIFFIICVSVTITDYTVFVNIFFYYVLCLHF